MDNKGFQGEDQVQRQKLKKMFSWTDGLPNSSVVLDVGTYDVPLGNESCAAYFGETEFAIARESDRQWPASAARDQAVYFA
ncbi:hypothetical protein G5I_03938 [Acromyrmex echinatior]|uniref:Uncharacterized protein n=1 Tax=Acromyrmex echinatior TaxID=103372 RepID=F4WEA6_ACREC|nr:hypothetical protein G5I_03938 [Acromyrmex echinatior]